MTCSRRCREGIGRHRVVIEQPADQWRVGEVRQHRAVAGQQQLARVVAPQPAGVHLALEEARAAVEQRLEQLGELAVEDGATLERFASREADEVGVLLEEGERGAQHLLDLTPAFARA